MGGCGRYGDITSLNNVSISLLVYGEANFNGNLMARVMLTFVSSHIFMKSQKKQSSKMQETIDVLHTSFGGT